MSDMGLGLPEDLSPEELAYLEQIMNQMQTDPLARAVNDYGQGSDFLNLSEKPISWKRAGDKHDLYSDFFRTTKTWMPDYVDGLYPEAEDPGLYEGYRSDLADLYRGNSAYAQLEAAMAEGATFDQAVNAIAADPDYQDFLPKTEGGRPDRIGFRNSAEQYISERAREGREFDTWEAQKQEYEDFTKPRTAFDENPMDEDISRYLREIKPTSGTFGVQGGIQGAVDNLLGGMNRSGSSQAQGQNETVSSILRNQRANMDSPMWDGGGRDPRSVGRTFAAPSPTRNAARQRSGPATRQPARTQADRNKTNTAYNKQYSETDAFYRNRAKNTVVADSKLRQNQARLAAFYNAMIYGE